LILPAGENLYLVTSDNFTFCNSLLIEDEERGIIETGTEKHLIEKLAPSSMQTVWYTHHHFDHVRHNEYFPGAHISIHELDYPPLTGFELFFHYNSFDLWDELMPGIDYEEASIQAGLSKEEVVRSWHIDNTFKGEERVSFGKTEMEILHTPGHSAGHCSFWFPRQELLFSGDICLTRVGPWYGEVYASPDEMIRSIDHLIELKPTYIATSHIPQVCNNPVERLQEYRDRIFKREERIYYQLKKQPYDLHSLAQLGLIYKAHPIPFVLFWEKLILLKHLARLQKEGLVEKEENGYYRA